MATARIEFGPDRTDGSVLAYTMPALVPEQHVLPGGGDGDWVVGRAGMLYRDLLPGRLGGCFIASHIRIPEVGPVPDNVHFHQVMRENKKKKGKKISRKEN